MQTVRFGIRIRSAEDKPWQWPSRDIRSLEVAEGRATILRKAGFTVEVYQGITEWTKVG